MARPRIRVGSYDVEIPDLTDVTLGEASLIEDVTGLPFSQVGQALAERRIKAVLAVALVAIKRTHPAVTLADLTGVRAVDVEAAGGEDDQEDEPGPPAGDVAEPSDPATTPASSGPQ